jgi:hypothetical protein
MFADEQFYRFHISADFVREINRNTQRKLYVLFQYEHSRTDI